MEPNEKIADAELSYLLKTGRPDSKRATPPGSTPENVVKARQSNPIFDAPFPATAPVQATKPGTVMIGGIRHLDIPGQPRPGPLGMMAGAYAQTAAHVVTGGAENRIAQQREASRTGLDTTQELADKAKKDAAATPATRPNTQTNPLTQGIDFSAYMSPQQRSEHAEAYRDGVDKATGTGPGATLTKNPGGAVDFSTMEKRFDAYKKDDGLLATRNIREDMLGSGIRMSKDANGGIVISNDGNNKNPLLSAGGSSINMQEGNASIARANQARGEMIESMIKANGGNGLAILGEGKPTEAEKFNAQGKIDGLIRDIKSAGSRTEKAAFGQALQTALAGQSQMAVESMRQGGERDMRGHELASKNAQAGIMADIEKQKLGVDAPHKQAQTDGLMLQNKTAKQLADLQTRAANGDTKALDTLRSLNSKGDRYTVVSGGQEWDQGANAMRNVPASVLNNQTGEFVTPPSRGGAPKFSSPAEVAAAKAAGKIKAGDVIETPNGMIRVN